MKENNNMIASGLLLDGRYKLLHTLSSEGGTADVWLALDTNTIDEVFDDELDKITTNEDTGIKVAIKIYRPKNALDLGEQRFREEFKIVFNCHHSNLVQPINFSTSNGIPYLVLPFCKNGSSEKLLGKFHDKNELWRYISDVSSGLAYLHSFNPTIVHHDIKPANVLIDDNNNYAITDFGISSHSGLNPDGYDENQSGTTAYMAPERFLDDYESSTESDMWSFGATLYELITGKVPFGENGGVEQLEQKLPPPAITQDIPLDMKRLIYDCLAHDPSKRPSAELVSKCAQSQCYPLKHTKKYIYIGCAVMAAIVVGAFLFLFNKQTPPTQLSNEEVYENAMKLVNSTNADSLKKGMAILDNLCSLGYVPALYEAAYTYGWYADSTSCARKDLLGIEYDAIKLPIDNQINRKAISYLSTIDEKKDPAYPELNARAIYRLACYYGNEGSELIYNPHKTKILLDSALAWANKCNNIALVEGIKRRRTKIEEEINKLR